MSRIAIGLAVVFTASFIRPTHGQEVTRTVQRTFGPSIGIRVTDYRLSTPSGNVYGARVTSDMTQRNLYQLDGNGNPITFKFRTGADVILKVNNASIRGVNDIRRNTRSGWNILRVWDTQTGDVGNYYVRL